jgi:hypothetical protein
MVNMSRLCNIVTGALKGIGGRIATESDVPRRNNWILFTP